MKTTRRRMLVLLGGAGWVVACSDPNGEDGGTGGNGHVGSVPTRGPSFCGLWSTEAVLYSPQNGPGGFCRTRGSPPGSLSG